MPTEPVVSAMSLEERASLTAGHDVWHLPAIERLGIGALKMSDGPSGVRGERIGTRRSLSFPCGMAVGATWDVELAARYGSALGDEARSKGVHLLLGPTVCIPRTPLAGRTFESFAEDPYLSARITVAYIRAVQARGVGCCVKHFACNDQEHERMSISAEVDERTLREIHLPSFEAAVGEANTWAVMSAYNRLNGTYCGEHPDLLGRILKDEWGFDGVVVSDWFGTHSTAAAAIAGLDIEMPGPPRHLGPKLAAAVEASEVDAGVLDEHVRRIVALIKRCGLLDEPAVTDEAEQDDPPRRALARELAISGTVLLRNESLLPLRPEVRRVALIGPNAVRLETGGGGSSSVTPLRYSSLLDELRSRLPGVEVAYEEGCRLDRGVAPMDPRLIEDGLHVEYFATTTFEGEPVSTDTLRRGDYIALGDPVPGVSVQEFSLRATAAFRPDVDGVWEIGVANAGAARLLLDGRVIVDNTKPKPGRFFYGAGSDTVASKLELTAGRTYELVVEFQATGTPLAGFQLGAARPVVDDALGRAVTAAGDADVAIVVVGSNSQWESEGRDRPDLRLVGEQDALVRAVLAANANTAIVVNAGAPVEMPWADDAASVLMLWYPGEEGAAALADVLTGIAEPSGRLPISFPKRLEDSATHGWYPGADGKVVYGEGLLVGYRHFDTNDVEPAFCFGHGLSYTTFVYDPPTVEGHTVTLGVTNTGTRRGSEVVQLYVCRAEGPAKELKAFAKVTLDAGESTSVRLELNRRSFATWDTAAHDWVVVPGAYQLAIGASSRDIRHRVSITS
ncbi:MAG: beta-glucosidase [Acidimicrobiales bacterium]